MESLLSLVPPADRPAVAAVAGRLAEPARRAAPTLPAGLVGRVVEAVAAGVPGLPDERLMVLVRWSLWAYLLDDRLDAPDTTAHAVDEIRAGVCAALAGQAPEGDEPLAAAIADILKDLRLYGGPAAPPVDSFRRRLAESVTAAAELVRLSRRVADGAPPPSLDGYLRLAGPDVYYRPFGLAVLALLEPAVSAADLAHCDRALEPAATAVRLANDLRSLDRDRAEGQLNVLILAEPDGSPGCADRVQSRIAELVGEHRRMLAPVRNAAVRAVLTGSLDVALGVYRHADLR